MSFITTFMKNVKDFYSEINAATLTGAIDVIVVEHEDGSLNSSPFHVRFGKMGVLKSREKIVDLEINGEPVDIWMKLDDTGAAFFVEDVEDAEGTFNPDLATSPLPKKLDHYLTDSSQTILPDVTEQPEVDLEDLEESADKRNLRKKRKTRRELMLTRSGSRKCPVDEMFDMEDTDDEVSLDKELSVSELADVIETDGDREPTRISFSSGYISDQDFLEGNKSAPLPDYQALMSKSVGPSDLLLSNNLSESKISHTFSEPSMMHLTEAEEMGEDVSWKWGELPKHDEGLAQSQQTSPEQTATRPENNSSWFGWSKKTAKSEEEAAGVYLDEIEQNPDLMEKYIGSYSPDPLSLDEEPQSEDAVLLSVCGPSNLSEGSVTNEKFQSNLINYDSFVEKVRENPNFLADSEILLRLNGKYLPWPTAAPILLSRLLFKANLPSDLEKELTVGCQNVESKKENESETNDVKIESNKSWFGWFGKSDKIKNPSDMAEELSELKIDVDLANSGDTEASDASEVTPGDSEAEKRYRKTIRLTSDQLKKLNLKRGMNEVEFSVTTAFQGTTRCKCHIYLWHHTDKVVISDIDGTITKSDVLGHLLPVIGRDWAQSGVAHLYTKIRNNGYQIIYLSARAIGQASVTKDYLQSLKQGDVCLPDGPLFLNPDSLIHAFKREVIDRNPEEFKIRCLKDIQSLFNGKNPFFAGYGNRPNDAYAYRAVGIPVSRIFTINPAGELRHELTQNFQTSYESLSTEVDYYFPNIQTVKQIKEKFDAFPRKQSVYFDASEYMSIEEVAVEASENLSDTEEQVKPFRLRSGTDISDSLSTARLKLKNLKSKKVGLQSQWSINEDGFEQIE